MLTRLTISCLVLLLSLPASAGNLRVHLTEDNGTPIPDAVVEIITPQIPVPADWDYTGLMDQVDKEFIDNVVMVVAGSYVSFPNSDDIQHHVYSFSDTKSFELPLYSGNDADPVLFDMPGIAVVGCNIHDWMLGYIYVGQSHLMAKSGADGNAMIRDLPAGNYTFQVWHERARRRDQFSSFNIDIPATGDAVVELTLELGRDRRIRRAPTGTHSSYP